MKNKNLVIMLILVWICLLSTPIATVISDCIGITTDEYIISRIDNYSCSIRVACFIVSMYLLRKTEN